MLLVGIAGCALLVGCSESTSTSTEPPPADSGGQSPIPGSTWLVTSNALSAEGITNLLISFDPNNFDVVQVRYTFGGTGYDYGPSEVTGAAASFADGRSISVNAEWNTSVFEWEGTVTSSQAESVGFVAVFIEEGGSTAEVAGNGRMTKQ